jgi:dTDP-glucose 4,6-dehydratase
MLILLIGSNSFAGSNFAKYLLDKGYKVIGVSRSTEIKSFYLPYKQSKYKKNFKFFKINLNRDKDIIKLIDLIKKYKIKYIINFAAQGMVAESWLNPHDWYNTNVTANSKLINELSKLNLKKFLNFTTPEVYGDTKNKIKESVNFYPSSPYAVSRASQDMNLIAYNKFFNFPVVFTRTANIYGPGQQLYRIVPKTIISAILNKKIYLHGGGKSLRSFIFIDDVCSVLADILFDMSNIGKTFHISTNKFISIKNLVTMILDEMKASKSLISFTEERRAKDHGYFLDSSKIRKKYKWKEKISLDEGLKKTINYIYKNFYYIKNKSLEYRHKK